MAGEQESDATLTLPWEKRIKSRQRVVLDDGREAGLFLERGAVLRENDLIVSEDGLVVKIRAAEETVSEAVYDDALLMARICYHLGNRHAAVQIEKGGIRYLHDHVLDGMLEGLGLKVTVTKAPFEPEPGAFGGGHHSHA